MLASTLKARVRSVSREEAGAAGAAMMAAVQQKLYPDMEACAAQWVDPLLGDSTAPDAGLPPSMTRASLSTRKPAKKCNPSGAP